MPMTGACAPQGRGSLGRPPDEQDLTTKRPGSSCCRCWCWWLLGDHPADDRGQLFGSGHVRQQPVLLGRAWSGSASAAVGPHVGMRWAQADLLRDHPADPDSRLASTSRSTCPRRASGSVLPGLMSLPLLIPWNVVGTIWQIFGRVDIGLLGLHAGALGIDYNYTRTCSTPGSRIILMDVWHWTRWWRCWPMPAAIDPDAYYQAAKIDQASRWARVPLHRAAEDDGRADDRDPAALHGQLHDLHRALRGDRRRAGQLDHTSCRSTL
jgi:hypothetical protein